MRHTETDSVAGLLAEWRQERPDIDASPVGIQGRIMRLAAHLLRHTETWLTPLGLTWEAFSLIVTLRRSGKPFELRPTDVLKESLLTSGAITNRIDRVEAMGLVERRPDPGDRRGSIIRLTPAGRRLADRAIADHFAGVDVLLGTLGSGEREELASLLSRLLASFEAAPAGRAPAKAAPTRRRPAAGPAPRRSRTRTSREHRNTP